MNAHESNKRKLLYLLKTGRDKARSGQWLANAFGLYSDRSIRLIIRELIVDGHAIAAAVDPPAGYFLAETKEEAEEYMAVMKSRLVQDAYRRRDFKRASRDIREPEQMVMVL